MPTKLVLLKYNISLYTQLLYIIVAKGQVLVIGRSAKRPSKASFTEVKYKSTGRVSIGMRLQSLKQLKYISYLLACIECFSE